MECQVRVKEKSTAPSSHERKRKRPRSCSGKGGLGSLDGDDEEPVLPSAADLAQSFLQTEPEEERADLEAAILSETTEIGSESITSDDASEFSAGTGAALTLPGFITRALQGIVDRLTVKIHGVTVNLDVEIMTDAARSPPGSTLDPVTIQLKIDDVDIEGVTHGPDLTSTATESIPQGKTFKQGKRLVWLSKIRGALITEANLFSSLGRSAAMSSRFSPAMAHSDIFDDRKASKSYSSSRGGSMRNMDLPSSPDHSSTSSRRLSLESLPPDAIGSRSLRGSVIASDSGRFEDAIEEDDSPRMSDSRIAYSDMGDSVFQNSAYLDQISDSQFDDEEGSDEGSPSVSFAGNSSRTRFRSPASTPKPSRTALSPPASESNYFQSHSGARIHNDMLKSTILPTRPHSRFSQGRVSQSQSALPIKLQSIRSLRQVDESTKGAVDEEDESGEEDDSSTPVGKEDLSQSQIFSHEDAESMYMSAMSFKSATSNAAGDWDDRDADEGKPYSSKYLDPKTEHLDNLEHARKASPSHSTADIRQSLPSVSQASPAPVRTTSPPPQPTPNPPLSQISSNASERSNTSSDEYTKMSKPIFDLDRISIYLPAASDAKLDSSSNNTQQSMMTNKFDAYTSQSTSFNIPGAFSHYDTSRRSPRGSPPAQSKIAVDPMGIPSMETDNAVEIEIGNLLSHFDISVGRLVWKLMQKIKDSLQPEMVTPETRQSPTNVSSELDLKFTAERISLQFLERLGGSLVSSDLMADTPSQWISAPDAAVLLQTSLLGLRIETQSAQTSTETDIQLSKFVFGYAKEDIFSFDADLQMRSSVRDLKAAAGIDVSVKIKQTEGVAHCDIKTLPMHVSIDLQRLDETFSWFGGLSSVLNLGSSFASNATITNVKPKPRSVRFETPSALPPDTVSATVRNKVDARIGGFILDLVGEKCSIGVETSAVKIVSRDNRIGASVQKIRLSGPHIAGSNDEPAINMDVTATRIDFLTSPQEADLHMLLSLITPSKAKYDQDDDILLDTLLRQRKQGSVLRLSVDDVQTRLEKLDQLSYLPELGEEISRLSTVTKYLPDDDRPGLLSLVTLKNFGAHIDIGRSVGTIQATSKDIEIAQITLPALVALSVSSVSITRNNAEELVAAATDVELRGPRDRAPAIMARMIGDEMEPIVKIKLWNLRADYRVATLMAVLDFADHKNSHDMSASLSASIATLTGRHISSPPVSSRQRPEATNPPGSLSKAMTIDVILRDCILGLSPLGLPSQVLVVLTESHLSAVLPQDGKASATGDIDKASLLVIDNVANILSTTGSAPQSRRDSFGAGSSQVADLCDKGFVSVSYISSANATIQMLTSESGDASVDVQLRDDLFVLESCADSTQTLVAALGALAPPTPPSKETKYRTKVIPIKDLLASLSGDAFGTAEGDYNFDDDFGTSGLIDPLDGEESDDFNLDSHYYQRTEEQYQEAIMEDMGGPSTALQLSIHDTQDGVLLNSLIDPKEVEPELEELDFREDHFGPDTTEEGAVHKWNSTKNTYDRTIEVNSPKSPLKVSIKDVHIIWNLFDGYDWQHTRDTISKAVQDVESRAIERRARNDRRPTFEQDIDDEDTVIGDFLFNSIYIGIPGNRDPRELAAAINQELNDTATETESIATTTLSSSPSRPGIPRRGTGKRLRLKRSKRHKIAFELKGVCVDFVAFPPGSGETQSSIDVRVHDFKIFDHIPTSTWKMFATYMQEAGERETGASMIHIEILNVKPKPDLAASEIVLTATVLPLRLHVDQDALDFITRFFEFKDDAEPVRASSGDIPFLQRVEVKSIPVKLDFKPKRVDYAGLRSGHTTEFMNFLILDEADMILQRTILYGVSGFDRLGKELNNIWMPEIKRNQLPGILAGLAPVRPLVNVGGGLRHLVQIPMREYKKDGRIVRGVAKGAGAFAKTTGTELIKLGAKVAIGVQAVLQNAETILSPQGEVSLSPSDDDDAEEVGKHISLYANQPVGVLQGLRGGYTGLQRDLLMARDAIIAVPGEVMEGGNAAGVLRAVRRHAPTVILRPVIGVAKAGGQILMGATNSLDPANLQRADAVSFPLLYDYVAITDIGGSPRNIKSIDELMKSTEQHRIGS